MKKYKVEVRAVLRKEIAVEAGSEEEATELAHELFDLHCDGYDEDYNQETVSCVEVKECDD